MSIEVGARVELIDGRFYTGLPNGITGDVVGKGPGSLIDVRWSSEHVADTLPHYPDEIKEIECTQ